MEINNAAVPDINELDHSRAQWLVSNVVTPGLALLDGRPAGVIIVLSDLHDQRALPVLKIAGQRHEVVVIQLQDPAEQRGLSADLLAKRL